MILDFDDQDDGTSEIHRDCPNIIHAWNELKMVGETHKHGIVRI
jgi:hypothetical protein